MTNVNGHNKKIYLDTDVLVASQMSNAGAAYWIINHVNNLKIFSSSDTLKEFKKVCRRLNLKYPTEQIQSLKVIKNSSSSKELDKYLIDIGDLHILDAAIKSKSEYLLTFNLKDYEIDKIKTDFQILVIRPGEFLQYLRSLD